MLSKGSCLCGEVTFSTSQFMPSIAHCHCSMCRKFHGAAFSTYAEVRTENFKWLTGKSLLSTYQAPNQTVRTFCQNCGSSLTFESKYNREDNTIEVSLAAFDTLEALNVNAHIFTESKVSWLKFTDELPKFLKYRM